MIVNEHHLEETEAETGTPKGFYNWPSTSTLEFESLYEEMRRRHPRVANVNLGLALLQARYHTKGKKTPQELIDEAEACLKP